jgi:hypothetical protein
MTRLSPAPLIALLALTACSLPTADKQSDAEARALYEEIRTGADLSKDTHLSEELTTPDALAQLAEVKGMLPPGAPEKIENRSWKYNASTDGAYATLVHAYIYKNHTVLAETVLKKPSGGEWKIAGFHVHLDGPPGQSDGPPVTVTGPPGEKT